MLAKAKVSIGETEVEVQLLSKTFSSGKRGFWGQAKVEDENGKRYQVQTMAVEVAKKA